MARKVRGRLTVLCAAAALLLAGCGGGSSERSGPDPAEVSPSFTAAEELPERLAADGTTVLVGDPGAKVTVHLYEDPRCPVCEQFETGAGNQALRRSMLRREARTQYTMASFLDDRLGGSGSGKAVNALRAALEQGKFVEYHEVLYYNQPEESTDGYTDAVLLKLADQVPGLRGEKFDSAVRTMRYRSFVVAAEKAYERAGGRKDPQGPGTPTAVINNRRIPQDHAGILMDGVGFENLLASIHRDPWAWQQTTF